ncbi:polysaccharide deacetylase family protein [bacterium]|nr:polysaccharide deacetylase family protein [bacterium]
MFAARLRVFFALLIILCFADATAALGNQATDEETGASYYVYDDSESGYSGEIEAAGDGNIFNFSDFYLDSRDDALMDEMLASRMNLDSDGNPIVFRLMRGNPARREVALSFDDGPHPRYTSRILSILQHHRVHATFFMVGFMANRYPHWAKQVAQLGNEIGNHTYDHFRLTKLPADEVDYQITQTQEVLYQITGRYPRFVRPPGGRYDQAILQEFADNGLAVGLWTHNSKDVDIKDPYAIYNAVMDNLENGTIILMHDGSDATIEVLPKLIESIKAKGYTFVTLGEMLDHMEFDSAAAKDGEEGSTEYSDWRIKSY